MKTNTSLQANPPQTTNNFFPSFEKVPTSPGKRNSLVVPQHHRLRKASNYLGAVQCWGWGSMRLTPPKNSRKTMFFPYQDPQRNATIGVFLLHKTKQKAFLWGFWYVFLFFIFCGFLFLFHVLCIFLSVV